MKKVRKIECTMKIVGNWRYEAISNAKANLYRFVQVFKWKSTGKLSEREQQKQQKHITTK